MKKKGKIFEEDFANSFPQNIFIYRLRDTSSSWQNDNNNDSKSRFTAKNICDFIAFSNINKKILLLELKSFKGSSCPFSNVKTHQIESLYVESQKEGVDAYFIFNFRDISKTFAIKAEKISQFYKKSERKSFDYNWCSENGIFIDSRLKRTRFAYSIDKLLAN